MIARPTDFNDFANYSRLLTIWHNQSNQDDENKRNHDNFITAANSWLIQAKTQQDHGQPLPPKPPLPRYVNYNDDGTITYTNFPDLIPPELMTTTPGSGSGVSTNPPMDRTDVLLMLVGKICDKLGIK